MPDPVDAESMPTKPETAPLEVAKAPRRRLESDLRPLERCCGHHLLAHDAIGCLITGCRCKKKPARGSRGSAS
jgi:hypothetical protein